MDSKQLREANLKNFLVYSKNTLELQTANLFKDILPEDVIIKPNSTDFLSTIVTGTTIPAYEQTLFLIEYENQHKDKTAAWTFVKKYENFIFAELRKNERVNSNDVEDIVTEVQITIVKKLQDFHHSNNMPVITKFIKCQIIDVIRKNSDINYGIVQKYKIIKNFVTSASIPGIDIYDDNTWYDAVDIIAEGTNLPKKTIINVLKNNRAITYCSIDDDDAYDADCTDKAYSVKAEICEKMMAQDDEPETITDNIINHPLYRIILKAVEKLSKEEQKILCVYTTITLDELNERESRSIRMEELEKYNKNHNSSFRQYSKLINYVKTKLYLSIMEDLGVSKRKLNSFRQDIEKVLLGNLVDDMDYIYNKWSTVAS